MIYKPYELLCRYDGVGPTGAHIQFAIYDDEGTFVSLADPLPLSMDNFPCNEIMTDTMKIALLQIQNLNKKISERDRLIGDLQGENQDLQQQNEGISTAYTNLKNAVEQASQQTFSFMPSAL